MHDHSHLGLTIFCILILVFMNNCRLLKIEKRLERFTTSTQMERSENE